MSLRCTTHFHACDCREEKFKLLEQRLKEAEEVIKDFRDFGTRHDTHPTGQFRRCGCFDSFKGDNWQSYIRSQDESVRERARAYFEKYGEKEGV